jgi:hypothetical protein
MEISEVNKGTDGRSGISRFPSICAGEAGDEERLCTVLELKEKSSAVDGVTNNEEDELDPSPLSLLNNTSEFFLSLALSSRR